jgi:hypothetical protein
MTSCQGFLVFLFILFFLVKIPSEISIFSIIALAPIALIIEQNQKKKHSNDHYHDDKLHIWRKLVKHEVMGL